MIRVTKSDNIPTSLVTKSTYDGEDVKRQLFEDQHDKCYLCERKLETDFNIEHFKSQQHYPQLKNEWSNLLLACGYCNQKKSDRYDCILNPLNEDIEKEICQRIDYKERKAVFTSSSVGVEHVNTIKLLESIFNGTERMRKLKEEKFFNHVVSVMNNFMRFTNRYLLDPNDENAALVRSKLSKDEEFLGLKYWVIKDNPNLMKSFSNDICWNKVAEE